MVGKVDLGISVAGVWIPLVQIVRDEAQLFLQLIQLRRQLLWISINRASLQGIYNLKQRLIFVFVKPFAETRKIFAELIERSRWMIASPQGHARLLCHGDQPRLNVSDHAKVSERLRHILPEFVHRRLRNRGVLLQQRNFLRQVLHRRLCQGHGGLHETLFQFTLVPCVSERLQSKGLHTRGSPKSLSIMRFATAHLWLQTRCRGGSIERTVRQQQVQPAVDAQ
jgi:hypothetical protein